MEGTNYMEQEKCEVHFWLLPDGKCNCPTFRKELEKLINKYSMENGSDTPDFILAEYMYNCLKSFNEITKRRDEWYGRHKGV